MTVFRRFLFGLLVCIALIFVLPFFESDDSGPSKVGVEIFDSRITGYHEGMLSWTILSRYIESGRSRYFFKAKDISAGNLFDSKGQLVMTNLKAHSVVVRTKSKSISATGNVSAEFIRRKQSASLGGVDAYEGQDERVKIHAEKFKYFSTSKRTYLMDNVTIEQGKTTVYPKEGVWVDHDENIAYIEDGFKLDSDGFLVTANVMTIYIDEDYSEIDDYIRGFRPGKVTTNMELDSRERVLREKDTYLRCDYMVYRSLDKGDVVEVSGNVRVYQDEKQVKADRGVYYKDDNKYSLSGHVQFRADNLSWIVDKEKKGSFSNPDISSSIEKPVTVNCNTLSFNSDLKLLKVMGDVVVDLDDKRISCQKLEFDDATDYLKLSGTVKVEKENMDTFYCQVLLLNIQDETFFAEDNIRTEFRVKKNK